MQQPSEVLKEMRRVAVHLKEAESIDEAKLLRQSWKAFAAEIVDIANLLPTALPTKKKRRR